MSLKHVPAIVAAAMAVTTLTVAAQNPPPRLSPAPTQTPAPNADPYANNPNAGATQFPLAAAAGKDSGAKTTAPAGAVNQGAFDPATWKYGAAFAPPAGAKVWNPAKLKLMQDNIGNPAHRVALPVLWLLNGHVSRKTSAN